MTVGALLALLEFVIDKHRYLGKVIFAGFMYFGLIVPAYGYGEDPIRHDILLAYSSLRSLFCFYDHSRPWTQQHTITIAICPSLRFRICYLNAPSRCVLFRSVETPIRIRCRTTSDCCRGLRHLARSEEPQ